MKTINKYSNLIGFIALIVSICVFVYSIRVNQVWIKEALGEQKQQDKELITYQTQTNNALITIASQLKTLHEDHQAQTVHNQKIIDLENETIRTLDRLNSSIDSLNDHLSRGYIKIGLLDTPSNTSAN
jgi:hypothetical protein